MSATSARAWRKEPASFNQLPYQAALGIGNNQLTGLGNLQSMLQGQANLGGQSFALPQQTLNDLQSYLGLGQSAKAAGLQGGQMGVNQLASGLAAASRAPIALFNPNSGLFPGVGSSIGSGIGGLFGGSGTAVQDFLAASPGAGAEVIPGVLDTSGSGALLAAAPVAAGS